MEAKPVVLVRPDVEKRFFKALDSHRIILFSAPCGCGKTASAEKLMQSVSHAFRSAEDEDCLDWKKNPLPPKCAVFVLDNLQSLTSKAQQELLCERIRGNGRLKFLLLSRGGVPGWLMPFQFAGLMETFTMSDFLLDRATTRQLLEENGVSASESELAAIHEAFRGYGIVLSSLCRQMQGGAAYTSAMEEVAKRELFVYFEEAVYRRFEQPMRTLLLSVAPFDGFTVEMARTISGDNHTGELVGRLIRETTMATVDTVDNMDTYCIHPIFRAYLIWQMEQDYTPADRRALFDRAGLYYELRDDLVHALDCYTQSEDSRKITELLVKHARLHPGAGHYYDVEPYYRALPEEDVLRSPAMMNGMSMLCALTLDYDGSERWYGELKRFCSKIKRTDSEYKEAHSFLAYLDIALPQRGSKGLVNLITSLFTILTEKKLTLPAFSVTSTLPSVMNGGKDFCNWSKKDELLYATMAKPLEVVLGKDGICLADCAICESKFEKGEEVSNRLLNLIARLGEVQRSGTPDIEFAIVGLLARDQVIQGRARQARDTVETLRAKFVDAGETRFLPNMDAMLCRIDLRMGNQDGVERWYREKAPKDYIHLRAMWRYQYITCAMVEITRGAYDQALLMLAPLGPYCEKCGREMDGIYLNLLSAICRSRMGDEAWQPLLHAALDACLEYQFVRPVSQFGVAVLPLLTQSGWSRDKAFLHKLISATRTQAVHYPEFLRTPNTLIEPLSAAEQQVLKLLCHNMSNQEIGDILGIKVPTVKTHVSHILQKLCVKRRSEAKEAAETLHLI